MADMTQEIRRLQQQFRAVQQQDTTMKLSEHSCVEIMQKLVQLGLIQIHFTLDGKVR